MIFLVLIFYSEERRIALEMPQQQVN